MHSSVCTIWQYIMCIVLKLNWSNKIGYSTQVLSFLSDSGFDVSDRHAWTRTTEGIRECPNARKQCLGPRLSLENPPPRVLLMWAACIRKFAQQHGDVFHEGSKGCIGVWLLLEPPYNHNMWRLPLKKEKNKCRKKRRQLAHLSG